MADERGERGRLADTKAAGMKVDTSLVRELAELLNETGLTEIEVEDGDRKIRVSRGAAAPTHAAISAAVNAPAGTPSPDSLASPSSDASSTAELANAIRSPMVGTVYLAADPGAGQFVNKGDAVKAGDTLLIVEAMKVMNPIHATSDGIVADILVENAQPVEFDQPLIMLS